MTVWNIEQAPSQKNKVAVVTGANSGIGFETTVALASKGVHVILASRDRTKAEDARTKVLQLNPAAKVSFISLDLARLKDVRRFAADFQKEFTRLDFLINNAGIMMSPMKITEDGFENQMATNYIGHFALTGLLMPMLLKTPGSRVVHLTSLSYKWAKIDFDDIHAKRKYSRRKAYGQSKRACLAFSYELQRRLFAAQANTISVAAHPGLAKTNLDQYFPKLIRPLGSLFLQSAKNGALPVLYAALSPGITGGEFIGPDGFQQMRGNPTIVGSDEYSQDPGIGERLWKVSEEMTGVRYL